MVTALLILTLVSVEAVEALPMATLTPGEFYFRVDGQPTFLLGRNPTGWQVEQFAPLLQWSEESGERLARIHMTIGWPMGAPPGEIDAAWAARWDQVLDLAAQHGVYVVPVFGVWGQWNDGSQGEAWHFWDQNRYAADLGGPAQNPADLLGDTECRRLWLQWLEALVRRWGGRANILAWEAFSELDLITGSSEDAAVGFMSCAAAVIRAADPQRRPVTASLAGTNEWPRLFASDSLDLVQVHPYGADLSDRVLASVRARRARYGKPVLIGECGLTGSPPAGSLAEAPRAAIGINHAIWAAVVSGALNGRMLWWEDGYDQYERLELRARYRTASVPVARFLASTDFGGMAPLEAQGSADVTGAALSSDRLVLAWFRDAQCQAPDWPIRDIIGATVVLRPPFHTPGVTVEYWDTRAGGRLSTTSLTLPRGPLTVPLPLFRDSVALKLVPTDP